MKKYILSLFALLAFLMPVVGLSAQELTDPGTVDGEKQSPLYRLFYKEHRITSNDSTAYVDSDGVEHSFNDIFETYNVLENSLFKESTDGWNSDASTLTVEDENLLITGDGTSQYPKAESTQDLSEGNSLYVSSNFQIDNNDGNVRISVGGEYLDYTNLSVDEWVDQSDIETAGSEFYIQHRYLDSELADGAVLEVDYIFSVDMSNFESSPSQASMDTYRDVYLTVEEGETYYYYTFDGGFISILWVAVLFSGSYLYIRKAEVEDTKQAMVQASIFFIIGLVLLRVIQTVI